jgi:hypothetical protein
MNIENFDAVSFSPRDFYWFHMYWGIKGYLDSEIEYDVTDIYSKIVVRFTCEKAYKKFIKSGLNLDERYYCYDINEVLYELLIFTLGEGTFENVCEDFKNYKCHILQYRYIQHPSLKLVE